MPSPWEDFQSSCKLLVIGICHLPSSPNLDSVLADFIDAARSYPSTPTSPSPSELILAVQPLPTDVVVASRARVSQAQPIHFTHRRENAAWISARGGRPLTFHIGMRRCATVMVGRENYTCAL
jgi:hypothetical protein